MRLVDFKPYIAARLHSKCTESHILDHSIYGLSLTDLRRVRSSPKNKEQSYASIAGVFNENQKSDEWIYWGGSSFRGDQRCSVLMF